MAEIYPPTPRRRPDNIIDTFAVAYPPGRRITFTLSKPVAVYPFPDRVGDGSDQFKVVEFNKEKIKGLLPRTRPGTPNWRTLWHDLDHDPVYVTATLKFHSCDPTLVRDIVQSLNYILPLAFLWFLSRKEDGKQF